jgi:hypothetical protein
MRERLARIEFDDQVGLTPDLKHQKSPLYRDGQNVVFEDNSIQPLPGRVLVVDTGSEQITGVLQTTISGTRTLFAATPTKLYKWTEAGGLSEVGSGFTAGRLWAMIRWGTWVAATDGVNAPQIWKGATFAALDTDGQFTTAMTVLRWERFALWIGLSGDPNKIIWSDIDDIEDYVALSSNLSRDIPLRDLDSDLVAAALLGKYISIYTKSSMHVIVPTQAPLVFVQGAKLSGIGAWGKATVVSVAAETFGFDPRGFWRSDGNSYERIDHDRIHDYVFNDLNTFYAHFSVSWYDARREMVWWSYPRAGATANNRSVGYNRIHQTWTISGIGYSSVDASNVFDNPIGGDSDGKLWQIGLESQPITDASGGNVQRSASARLRLNYGGSTYGGFVYGGDLTVEG